MMDRKHVQLLFLYTIGSVDHSRGGLRQQSDAHWCISIGVFNSINEIQVSTLYCFSLRLCGGMRCGLLLVPVCSASSQRVTRDIERGPVIREH